MPKYTRRHYEAIADTFFMVLADYADNCKEEGLVMEEPYVRGIIKSRNALADMFYIDNVGFDHKKFYDRATPSSLRMLDHVQEQGSNPS